VQLDLGGVGQCVGARDGGAAAGGQQALGLALIVARDVSHAAIPERQSSARWPIYGIIAPPASGGGASFVYFV
jgi:hypothetical protein